MIYIARFILWFVIIVIVSWMLHRFVGKRFIQHETIRKYFGLIVFFIIMLTPVTIAKTVQLYYCWKYQPFYEIIEPLGKDFEGWFYSKGNSDTLYTLLKEYPTLKYVDTKKLLYYRNKDTGYESFLREDMQTNPLTPLYAKEIEAAKKELIEHKKETYVYVREYLDKQSSEYCTWPKKELNVENLITHYKEEIAKLEEEGRQVASGKVFKENPERYVNHYLKNRINKHLEAIAFLQSGQCVAKKIIPEEEVSRYVLGGGDLEYKEVFKIPSVAYMAYQKFPTFMDRITGKIYAWSAFIDGGWDLYGAFNWWGGGPKFYCGKGFNLTKKMIEEKGVNHGN
jgi:hypothetical protein